MNDSLTIGKRLVAAVIAAVTVVSTVGFAAFVAPQTANAATAGSLVKGPTLSAVYYVGHDGARYTIPNEKTYMTWYNDFNSVSTISESELADITLAGNIVYRPGSRWIKIDTDPKTYAVARDGSIHWIETEDVATDYAGADWNTTIDDVPDVFFVDYSVGASLMAATAFDGMLYMDGANKYVAWDGEKRMISDAGVTANRLENRFFLDGANINDSALVAGADITGFNCDLSDAAQTGCAEVPVGGDVTVSAAASTPAGATLPKGANSVPVFSFNVSAGSEASTVSQVVLNLTGLGETANIAGVYLYEGNTRLTNKRTVNTSTRNVTFGSLNLPLNANQTRTLTARVEVANGATPGQEIRFRVADAGSVFSTGNVGGTFPITGNTFMVGGVEVGTVTAANSGVLENPALGDNDAMIASFSLSAANEDASLRMLTVKVESADDHNDYKLWTNSGTLHLANGTKIGKNLVKFDLSASPRVITTAQSQTLQVSADIGGQAGEDIDTTIENLVDVEAIGGTYGFGMTVVNNYTGSNVEVQGGDLTIVNLGPTAGTLSPNSTNNALLNFSITATQPATIEQLRVEVNGDNDVLEEVSNVRVVNNSNGALLLGPDELDGDDGVTFTDEFSLNAGETLTLSVRVDLGDLDAGDELSAILVMDDFEAVDVNDDAITNVVPATDVVGYVQTISTTALAAALASTPANVNAVQGTNNVHVGRFNLSTNTAGSATVSGVVLDLHITGEDDGGPDVWDQGTETRDFISSCSLYNAAGTLVASAKSPATSGETMTFTGMNWTIPANTIENMDVKCNFAKTAETDPVYLSFELSNVVAVNQNGAVLDVDNLPVNGDQARYTVLRHSGSLAASKDSASPSAGILVMGSAGNHVSTYRLTATWENFMVDTLTVAENSAAYHEAGASGYASNLERVSIEYKNAAGTDVTKHATVSGNTAKFTGLDAAVVYGSPARIKAFADVSDFGTAQGTTRVNLGLLDGAGNFRAVGTSSGTVITEPGDVTTTSEHVVMRSMPTFSLAATSPSGTNFVPGVREALRFNVAANAAQDVVLDQMLFSFTHSGWINCEDTTAGHFALYRVGASPQVNLIDDVEAYDATLGCDATDLAYASMDLGGLVVPAGSTHTFALHMNAGAAADGSLQVGIATDPVVANGTFVTGSNAAAVATATATSITLDATANFAQGDVILNTDTGEKMLVTAVVDGELLSVVRGYAGTQATAVSNLDTFERAPGALLWSDADNGMASTWGGYLVPGLPVTGGSMGF